MLKHPSALLQYFFTINLLKSRGDKVIIIPWETGSMHILVPGLVQRQIRYDKVLQYVHIQGHKNYSILLLLFFNIIILGFVVRGDVFVIPNVSMAIGILVCLLFILEFGPKCFLFITDKGFLILKTVLRLV